MMMMMTRDQGLTRRWWSRRKEPLRRTNQYHKPRGKQIRRKGRRHTPVYVYRAGFWWGKVHLCPPHKGRKNSYFNNLPTKP